MSKQFNAAAGLTALSFLLPATAVADVTALEVWENWKSYAEAFGQTITVDNQTTSGDTLVLSGVTMSLDFPEGRVAGTLEQLEFRERGDGTVAITLSPDFPFSVNAAPAEGEQLDLAMIVRQTGASIVASGTSDSITYDYLAAEIGVVFESLIVDDVDLDPDIRMTLRDIDGRYAYSTAEQRQLTSDMTAGSLDYVVNFTDPESGGQFSMDGSVKDIASNSDLTMPAEFIADDPAQIFRGAVELSGAVSYGAVQSHVAVDDGDESFDFVTTTDSARVEFDLREGSIGYGGNASGISYRISGAEIPFPELNFAIEKVGFNLLMPMARTEGPADFGLLLEMVGLQVDDMLWQMFDGAGQLPHDPATLILDIAGQMNWLVEITDAAATEEFGDEVPAELHNLDLRNFTLSMLGTEITGNGSFTFNNDDLETFDGMPAPEGALEFTLVGINGLLDRLSAMGMLPEDQAMGTRMMLGLFARPGGGEDTLISTIEVKPDGSVFANGQQLQ